MIGRTSPPSRLVCVGITHKTAPPEVRGRFQFPIAQQRALLADLACDASERAILGTCGRFEVYALIPAEAAARRADRLWHRVARFAGAADDFGSHVRCEVDDACAKHLLRVAAGIESRVVGERQILDQTRAAFLLGSQAGAVGPVLSALFRTAIHAGRRVRRDMNVDDRDRLVARLAVDRIARAHDVRSSRIVVVGGGRMAADAAAELAARKTGALVIVNRSADTAERIARSVRAAAMPLDALSSELAIADAAIVATASSRFVVDAVSVGFRNGRPLTIVDLSVPRNVDPAVSCRPGVELTHLDSLAHGGDTVGFDGAGVERVIDEQLKRFQRWLAARSVAPVIRAMVQTVDSADPVETASRRRALHGPIVRLVDNVAA